MRNWTDAIVELAEIYRPEVVAFCQELIRVPALPGKEKAVADLYLAEMEKLGFDQYFRDDWGNVIGIVEGNEKGPTIMFNAHLDHTEVGNESDWEGYEPYGAEIDINAMENQARDGFDSVEVIHGRGAADAKAGGACQIYSGKILIELRKQGFPIRGRYMFTGVVQEETGQQVGMIKLLEETLPQKELDYDGVVSCEATSLKIYLGHRGRVELQVTVSGVLAHGSSPWLGINAVNKSTKFIDRMQAFINKNHKSDYQLGDASIALTIIDCLPGDANWVPDSCQIRYDRRLVPGETVENCLAEIQKIIDEMSAEDPEFRARVQVAEETVKTYTKKKGCLPKKRGAWKIEPKHPFVQAAAKGLNSVGQAVSFGYWDVCTDLSAVADLMQKPAIGYSPAQEFYSHRPIEKVRIDYMVKALEGNIAIFKELTSMQDDMFTLDRD